MPLNKKLSEKLRYWNTLIDKCCVVSLTVGGEELIGKLYTVDPIDQSVILLQRSENESDVQVVIIPGSNIESVVLSEENPHHSESIDTAILSPKQYSETVDSDRKLKILEWFKKNRFPVEEDGEEIVVAGSVRIAQPFTVNSCSGTNPVVIQRIKQSLQSFEKFISS